MTGVSVTHDGGDRFSIAIRGHVLHVDQPEPDGGSDTGPTPTELFVASLASCVAFYARRYLTRHNLPEEGLTVTAEAQSGANPSRVATMTISVTLPEGVPAERRQALLAVASHCTVHNTLTHPPEVLIQLAD
ncbi:MAG: OsmC family protein [Actinomycetota bacterium]|nr:OsmC family protein [Actinomycetota bacterium]